MKLLFLFKKNKQRNETSFLDSLRGLAALQVLIFHLNNALLGDNEFIARVFINGISPVSFFLCFEGFVFNPHICQKE